MANIARLSLLALIAALSVPLAAKQPVPADAARLKTLEAAVPPQDWYPPGYYDLRIAAQAEVAETPTDIEGSYEYWGEDQGKRFDLDCSADFIETADADALTMRYGNVALGVARRHNDLVRVGYPAAVWTEPLLAYERTLLAEATARTDVEVLMDLGIASDADYDRAFAEEQARAERGEAPMIEAEPPVIALGAAIEANRARLAPKLPRVTAEGCGGDAAPAPVIFKTVPPGGTVQVISSFAFKVCTRRLPDPWNPTTCRWNEVETGVPTEVRGRITYQIRWPDGSIRRGARNLDMNYNDETPTVATLRK